MLKNEEGITLVEVLATLLLLTLVTGIIWTTVSIATRVNVLETSTLQLQKEANYIIAELQQVHRQCYSYRLTINRDEIKVAECKKDNGQNLPTMNGIISSQFKYRLKNTGKSPYIDRLYISPENNLELLDFVVIDPIERNDKEKVVKVPTIISRYRIDNVNRDQSKGGK